MSQFKTGKPVGSTDPRDLFDNAENLDYLVNGPQPFYPDRLNKQRLSWQGMESQFASSEDARKAAFDAFLMSSGFVVLGDYGAGIQITARNQLLVRDGYLYRLGYDTTLPYTTTGNWALEGSNFVLQNQDDVLRQDLAAPTGSSLVMDGDKSVADRLKGLPATLASQGNTGTADGYLGGYGGSGASGVKGNGNRFNYYEFRIISDQVSQVNGENGADGTKVNGVHVGHNFGGAAAKGGRHAIEGTLLQGYGGAGATASDNPDRNYVGVQGQILTDSGDGGTGITDLRGGYFGSSSYAGIGGDGRYVANLTGSEFNTYIQAGNNDRVSYHSGMQIASYLGERGFNIDSAISVSNLGGSVKGWHYGLFFHDANGKWPFDADSTLLKVQAAGTNTLDRLIDVRNVNFTTSLISAQDVDISRGGMSLSGPAATVTLGNAAQASVTGVAGRSGGQGSAYDARLLFLGGSAANGQGVAQIDAAQCIVPLTRPGGDNTVSLGTASFRFSQLFAATGTINTSDRREKENIQTLSAGLDFVEALEPVSFTWKQGDASSEQVIVGYTEKEVPATEEFDEEFLDIELRDGKAVQVAKTRKATRNIIDTLEVEDENGKPVMETHREPYIDVESGQIAYREILVRKTTTIPRMKVVKEPIYETRIEYSAGRRQHFGLIAQQVKEAMQSVGIDDFAGWTIADPSDPDSRQGLRYDQLVPVLINAVKELKAQVDELKAK